MDIVRAAWSCCKRIQVKGGKGKEAHKGEKLVREKQRERVSPVEGCSVSGNGQRRLVPHVSIEQTPKIEFTANKKQRKGRLGWLCHNLDYS